MNLNPNLKKMKKFRFQLISSWIVDNLPLHSKIADIAGGKGILTHILNGEGFFSTVIDPNKTQDPVKYRLLDGKRVKIKDNIPYVESKFEIDMGKEYDFLISIHGHGSNLKIIDSAYKYKKKFLILPCCIIDEGIDPYSVTDWIEYLQDYANKLGIETQKIKFNFKGQRTGITNISN